MTSLECKERRFIISNATFSALVVYIHQWSNIWFQHFAVTSSISWCFCCCCFNNDHSVIEYQRCHQPKKMSQKICRCYSQRHDVFSAPTHRLNYHRLIIKKTLRITNQIISKLRKTVYLLLEKYISTCILCLCVLFMRRWCRILVTTWLFSRFFSGNLSGLIKKAQAGVPFAQIWDDW